jgi:CxxC motif-containing protein (DUF1111 family)
MSERRRTRFSERAAVLFVTLGVAALLSTHAATQAADERLGGATTVIDAGSTAFGRALANLDPQRWMPFRAGKARFVQEWPERGPWVDAHSCVECHYRDGRGPRADTRASVVGAPVHLVRLAGRVAGGDPIYGVQLRRIGRDGTERVAAPGVFRVEWHERRHRYPDGEAYALRRPSIRVSALAYGPLDAATRMSLRVAPPVFGLGLLEAVDERALLGAADPGDMNGDGVSGRVQQALSQIRGQTVVGRFGWKASQPTLAAQAAAALRSDLGVDDGDVTALVHYLRALAVPARRRWTEPAVRDGETLFSSIGCAACHRPTMVTGDLLGWPELSRQTIHPFTDLLLHDMGPDLADEVEEGTSEGSEWRTPPLWGLGLLATVGGAAGLLHDGRARTAEEAILWHGGEAERTRERFRRLPRGQRASLLAFLDSL